MYVASVLDVQQLLDQKYPKFSHLPITYVQSGWDAHIFRIGKEYVAKLSRNVAANLALQSEFTWVSQIRPYVTCEISVPFYLGTESIWYPGYWTLARWLEGETFFSLPKKSLPNVISQIVLFLKSLHITAPNNAPINRYRSCTLEERTESLFSCISFFDRTEKLAIEKLWNELKILTIDDSERTWIHGDFHIGNMLHDGKNLSGIIDFGDLCVGDPATDLACIWMIGDELEQKIFQNAYESSDKTIWQRSRAWALVFSTTICASSHATEQYRQFGEKTLHRVLKDR